MYTALGKIKKILIFNQREDQLTVVTPYPLGYGKFDSRIFPYSHLQRVVNAFNVKLYISFDYTAVNGDLSPTGIHDFSNVCLVGVHTADNIVSKWIQDTLILSDKDGYPAKAMICKRFGGGGQGVSVHHFSGLLDYGIIRKSKQVFDQVIEGGNVMRGCYQREDYILTGTRSRCDYEKQQLAVLFGVNEDRVHRFDIVKYDVDLEENFFHLDLYAMIVGPSKTTLLNEAEMLFVGKAEGDAYNRAYCEKFNSAMSALYSEEIKTCKTPFLCVEIPILVIDNVTIFSYCNCLVENFIDQSGKRVINLFFPDFRSELQKIADKHFADSTGANKKEDAPQLLAKYWKGLRKLGNADASLLQHIAILPDRGGLQMETGEINSPVDSHNLFPGLNGGLAHANPESINIHNVNQFILADMMDWIYKDIDVLISVKEDQIRTICQGFGADNVQFIIGDFKSIAQRKGSLHCMSLVIERGDQY